MARPIVLPMHKPVPKKPQFRRTYIREWRTYRALTLEQLASRLDMTASHLSMLERGQRGYTQETLERLAEALQTTAGSLLMRSPGGDSDLWTIWEQAKPGQRQQLVEIAKTLTKTGTSE
jgi:transcriptional regulator with XRE-family HTH domain